MSTDMNCYDGVHGFSLLGSGGVGGVKFRSRGFGGDLSGHKCLDVFGIL